MILQNEQSKDLIWNLILLIILFEKQLKHDP